MNKNNSNYVCNICGEGFSSYEQCCLLKCPKCQSDTKSFYTRSFNSAPMKENEQYKRLIKCDSCGQEVVSIGNQDTPLWLECFSCGKRGKYTTISLEFVIVEPSEDENPQE